MIHFPTKKRKMLVITILSVLFIASYTFYKSKIKNDHINLYGNVDIREVNLAFRDNSGRLKEMYYDEGDCVKEGDILAVLDKEPFINEMDIAEANVQVRKAILTNSETNFSRSEKLLKSGATTKQHFDDDFQAFREAQAQMTVAIANSDLAKIKLADTAIIAPSSGVILTRIYEPGSIVSQGQPVYSLSLNSPIYIRAYVTETQMGQIYQGMKAEVSTDSGSNTNSHI